MPPKRSYENSIAIFVDDLDSNFEDKHKCKPVMLIKARLGKRILKSDPFWDKCSLHKLLEFEDEKDPLFYRDSGISSSDLQTMMNKLKNMQHPNIKKVFFDWDRTLSAFDGIFDTNLIPHMKKDKCWDLIRDQMFGSRKRLNLIVDVLCMLHEQKRVQIVTNQDSPISIKRILKELAEDFKKPMLTKIPIWAYDKRKNIGKEFTSKFSWLRRELGKEECLR